MIRSGISVNTWRRQTPSVDAVRPSVCVCCGSAARPAGARLCVRGHGLRARQLRGPPSPGEAPILIVIQARRYRCRRCRAILIVVPSETAPRRHYAATAIAFSLALYGLCHQSHAEVRAQVSEAAIVAVAAERRWSTLSRWIDAVAERALFTAVPTMPSDLPRREVAARAAMAIGAHAPPTVQAGAPQVRAFLGAAQMP